jgi:hypothetical protein
MGAGFTLANLWPTLITGWSPSASWVRHVSGQIKTQEMLDLESEPVILSNHGIFVIFKTIQMIFFFDHGTNVGAPSSKACIYNV